LQGIIAARSPRGFHDRFLSYEVTTMSVRAGGIVFLSLIWLGFASEAGCADGVVPERQTESVIGRKVDSFRLDDFRGRTWTLADFSERPLVVVFLGTECPLVQLYAPRLKEFAEEWGKRQVQFVGIFSNQQDSLAEMAHFARQHKIEFPLLRDSGNRVADRWGAQRTPELFLLNGQREIVYHGRIDDQYTYGIQRPAVTRAYLREALEAVLANQPVNVATTEVVGCRIGRVLQPTDQADVTYSRQISRILQRRCVECHRAGEIGPFALTSYEETVGWAPMIEEVVREQRMPPWHANPAHGEFANEARLSDEEKKLIYRWVELGAPQGDPSELPPARNWVEGWRIGEPDLVIYMRDEPFTVPATGEVKYQYFSVDPGFTEDKWVRAAECRPGNRAVVHHIIVAPGSKDRAQNRLLGEADSDWLTATAPGAQPLILPPGMAKRIPAGSRLVFQMHYTPNGTVQEDRSCVGLIFADPAEVKQTVLTQKAANSRLQIPPGAPNHEVQASYRFSQDALLLAMFPHMHLRGKAFRYTAVYPDGREPEILLDVPHYDFNWQNAYVLAKPKSMPAGTVLKCVAHFDNSAANLANPDPTATVRWGDQTWEEMMIGYFDMVPTAARVPNRAPQARRTDAFIERAEQPGFALSPQLSGAAVGALKSNEALRRWGAELRKVMPQLDRVDWMTVEQGWLTIERVADAERGDRGTGRRLPAAALQINDYIAKSEPVMNPDITVFSTPDFQLMSRWFTSSLHIPVVVSGKPGLISFWSAERDAFPPAAVHHLTQVAKRLSEAPMP
jgi:peroxiredoxin/mono/diheme cytochrome c family protein